MDNESMRLQIRGRVQGVGFRYFTQRRASELQLRGFVRNQSDGSVEVVAAGQRERLLELLTALRQGPRGASVESIDEHWEHPESYFSEFHIR
jgi:acylphosphatase